MSHSLSRKEQENRTVGILVTVFFHVAILLLCWFWVAWMNPIPPATVIPEGVTIGFGTGDPEGGGDGSITSNAAPAATEQTDYTPVDPAQPTTPTTTPAVTSPSQTTPVVSGADPVPSAPTTPTPPAPRPVTHGMRPATPGTGTAGANTGSTGSGPGHGTGSGPTTGSGPGGNGGTGGSMNLSISGWEWKKKPNPQPCANNYTGSVTYTVVLDGASGRVDHVTPLKSNGIPKSVQDCI